MANITYVVDVSGNRNYINLDSSILSTGVSTRSNKVVTDTKVAEALDQFKSDNITDEVNFVRSTKAPTGRAVASYVSNAMEGNVGGFLGNLSVAQVNSLTSIKKGDSACMTDSGTITLGSVAVVAGDEIVYTTSNVWVKKLTTYVRPGDYATAISGGTILSKTNGNGYVQILSNGYGYVNGWVEPSTKLDLDMVDGNATQTTLSGLLKKSTNGGDIDSDEESFNVPAFKSTNSVVKNFSLTAIWTWIRSKITGDSTLNVHSSTNATYSNNVIDYGNTSSSIKIGYQGDSVSRVAPDASATSATESPYLATYIRDNGQTKMKDVQVANVTVGNADKIDGLHIVQSTSAIPSGSNVLVFYH